MIHVAPGFTFEVAGINPEAVQISGSGGIEITANGAQISAEGVTVSSEASVNSQPQVLRSAHNNLLYLYVDWHSYGT